jgi:hypothetical protein
MGDLLGFKGMIVNLVVRRVKKMVPAFNLPGSVAFNDAVSAGRNMKLSKPTLGPGMYDTGFVLPDNGGTASGLTWNWGYNSLSQLSANQLTQTRLDGVPTIGKQDVNVSDPILGGEVIGGYQFTPFLIGKKSARAAFEIGYGYSGFSENSGFGAAGTATGTTDQFGLGAGADTILVPLPPYAGTATGPGPLIDLNPPPGGHTVIASPVTTAFQSSLKTTFHDFRIGPALDIDLTRRLSAGFGFGYSSVYADSSLAYVETVTFANPAFTPLAPTRADIKKGSWRTGAYAEVRLNYRFTDFVSLFVGGDIKYNRNFSFGDAGHQVDIGLGSTYGAKAGVTVHF